MARTTVRLLSRRFVAVSVGAGAAVAVLASAAAAGALPATASDAARDALAKVGVAASNAGGSETGRAHRAPQARPKPFATTTSSTSSAAATTSDTPATTTSTTSSSTTTAPALPGHRGDDNASDTAKEHADESSAVHGDKPRPKHRTTRRGPGGHTDDAASKGPRRKGSPTPPAGTTSTTTTAPSND